MSIDLTNKVKHLQEQYAWLQKEHEALCERVMALESVREAPEPVELEVDTLQPVKRGPGRPRKVVTQ